MAKKNQSGDGIIRPVQHPVSRAIVDLSLMFFDTEKDITRGHLRFSSENVFEKKTSPRNDIFHFNRARENITAESRLGKKQKERAAAVVSAIKSLEGKDIKSRDKTFIYCRPTEKTGIEFFSGKPHRMTITLNPEKKDEYAAALKVAAYRQEKFRETPFRRNRLYPQNVFMPDQAWLEKEGIVITPAGEFTDRFSISVRAQQLILPVQQGQNDDRILPSQKNAGGDQSGPPLGNIPDELPARPLKPQKRSVITSGLKRATKALHLSGKGSRDTADSRPKVRDGR